MKQSIRIIGGQYRGKQLEFPAIQDLRPTPNRVRETLFNWLMHDLRQACCLDAFAGSGALGFEAFSRFAKKIILVEKSVTVVKYLNRYATEFNNNQIQVICQDSLTYIQQTSECFDIIFLDPPFSSNILPEYIDILANTNVLKPGGLLYIESPIDLTLNDNQWHNLKKQCAGKVFYFLYQKNTDI